MDSLEDLFHTAPADGVPIERMLDAIGQELLHYARVLSGSAETAEDAVQDLLVALLQQGAAARSISAPRAWLFTVLRRKVLSYRRRLTEPLSERIGGSVEGDPAARMVLQETLGKLSEAEQEVVLLHLWEGLTFDEISQVLNIPRGTALSRYHRSVKELQARFGAGPPELGNTGNAMKQDSQNRVPHERPA